MNETYEASIRIKDLPREVDSKLNALATVQQRPKWEVIRAALCEYVVNHESEIRR
jgi:hypothetical protein